MSRRDRFAVAVAVLLGAVVRILPVAGAAAGVGDGGLFLAMVDDIRAANFAIPATTSYNGLDIPFVYPPLALLIAAGIAASFGLETLHVVAWMPVAVSAATVVAFAWLAVTVVRGRAAVLATFAYALMPHAYDWVVSGGGLTRGLGLLFALIAMAAVADGRRATGKTAVVAGVLLGLAALSHPQAAVFGVLGCAVLSAGAPRGRWLQLGVIAAASAAVVALPWLAMAAATHGLPALANASHRIEPVVGIIRMLSFEFSGAPFMDLFAVFAVLGILATLGQGSWRLLALLVATYVTGAGGGEFLAAAPWALFAGIGASFVVDHLPGPITDRGTRMRALLPGAAAAGLFLALVASLGSVADRSSKLQALTADHLAALAWVADHTSPGARFIVPTADVWGDDELSEWFPALAGRRSIGTVQGSEWLGRAGYEQQLRTHLALLGCAGSTASCYASVDPDAFVFVPKGRMSGPFSAPDCCPALRQTLVDAGYEIVYDGPGATVAQTGE